MTRSGFAASLMTATLTPNSSASVVESRERYVGRNHDRVDAHRLGELEQLAPRRCVAGETIDAIGEHPNRSHPGAYRRRSRRPSELESSGFWNLPADRLRARPLDEIHDRCVGPDDGFEEGARAKSSCGIANFQLVSRSSPTSVRVRHVTRSSASGARSSAGFCAAAGGVCPACRQREPTIVAMRAIETVVRMSTFRDVSSRSLHRLRAPARSSSCRQREHVVALRLDLALLAVEGILPDRISARSPRRAGSESDVLPAPTS